MKTIQDDPSAGVPSADRTRQWASTNPGNHGPARAAPSLDQVARRACALWALRGRPVGQFFEVWLEAERELSRAGEA